MPESYNWKNIRALLTGGFTDSELRRLCQDDPDFRPVYGSLSDDMGRDRVVDLVLEHARLKGLEEKLLDWAENENPARYMRHGPYVEGPTAQDDFVNREEELKLLAPGRLETLPSPYVLVDAPAGYGKSCLLRRLVQSVEADEGVSRTWAYRYVDLGGAGVEAGESAAAHIARSIRPGPPQEADTDSGRDMLCKYVVREMAAPLPEGRRRVLLIFDAVENLDGESLGWLYSFLGKLRELITLLGGREAVIVRVVIAGRDMDSFWEGYGRAESRRSPPGVSLKAPLRVPLKIKLAPFDDRPVQDMLWRLSQVAKVGLDSDTVAQIALEVQYLCGGHPGVIRSVVRHLEGESFLIGLPVRYFEEHREELVRAYLSPVACRQVDALGVELGEAVRTLSVFRRVNANTVQELIDAGMLSSGFDEVKLLGDLQRVNLLDKPGIREPFYRYRLLRHILALGMEYSDGERFRRLNRMAIVLYRRWVEDAGGGLPDTHLKATQRLLSVVEWLFHALRGGEMDEVEIQNGLCRHMDVLGGEDVSGLVLDEIRQDVEITYLLRHRFGDKFMAILDFLF